MVVAVVFHYGDPRDYFVETIESSSASNISISPQFSFYGAKRRVETTGS